MYHRFWKRFFDILLSFFGIVVLLPFMAIVAVLIKLDSKGPVIFKQQRVGKDKKLFTIYKFRSMSTSAPKNCAPRELKNADTYITKIGKIIRKTSIDEIPQLFNILKGQMSFIGPRPAGCQEFDLIEARDIYSANSVRPGLSGWAQVNGRDILASDVQLKSQLDGYYVKRMGLGFDIKIFFKTFICVFQKKGVVEGEVEQADLNLVLQEVAATAVEPVVEETQQESGEKQMAEEFLIRKKQEEQPNIREECQQVV